MYNKKSSIIFFATFPHRKLVTILSARYYPRGLWRNGEKNDTFTIIFPYPAEQVTPQLTDQVSDQVSDQVEIRDRVVKLLKFCEEPRFLKEIMKFLNLKHRTYFLNQILIPLIEKGCIRRTIPDKPKSRFQKYVAVKRI
jgi:ATP-dependent DNA helicase RecG